jgi:Enterobacterial TraT complement resistance protein
VTFPDLGTAGRLMSGLGLCCALAGCQAATTLIDKQNLDVQTHMSETIFLDPVPEGRHTVYVGARNTSDHPEIDLKYPLTEKLRARGYTIVSDPRAAQYVIQVNVLQAGPVDPKRKDAFLSSGYGGALDAMAVGSAAGALTGWGSGNIGAGVGVGLAVGAAAFLAGHLVKDVYFTVVTDIQLSARPTRGGVVRESHATSRSSGSSSTQTHYSEGYGASEGVTNYGSSGSSNSSGRSQAYETTSGFLKYNVRDVAYANQVNLKWENATPLLVEKLSSSVANLFE